MVDESEALAGPRTQRPPSAIIDLLLDESAWHGAQDEALDDIHGELMQAVRKLIFSGVSPAGRHAEGEAKEFGVFASDLRLLAPLSDMMEADQSRWSVQRALARIDSLQGDHFGKLALMELIAGELGARWRRDESGFVGVSVALARLQTLLRRIAADRPREAPLRDTGTVLLTTPPGEEHVFPLHLLDEIFVSRGWETRVACPAEGELVDAHLLGQRHDIICFSWSTGALRRSAVNALKRLRRHFRPSTTLLLAGGVSSVEQKEMLLQLGVDNVCGSGYMGLVAAEQFIFNRNRLPRLPDQPPCGAAPTAQG